jgi:membrane fusion protein (multidrug efflux system)
VDTLPAEFSKDSGLSEAGGRNAALADPPPKKGRGAVFLVLALVFGTLAVAGLFYWLDARHYETTDDAFIDGHVSQVAPQIGGRVTAILVRDNQMVTAGQKLLEIDPRDMQVRLMQALAQQAQTAAQLLQVRATLAVRQTDLGQAEANIRVADADLTQAQQDLARYRAINPRAITRQQLDNANSTTRSAAAKRDAYRQAASGMRAQIDVTKAQIGAAEAALRVDDANVANAKLQLSYATVVAPTPGQLRQSRPGATGDRAARFLGNRKFQGNPAYRHAAGSASACACGRLHQTRSGRACG